MIKKISFYVIICRASKCHTFMLLKLLCVHVAGTLYQPCVERLAAAIYAPYKTYVAQFARFEESVLASALDRIQLVGCLHRVYDIDIYTDIMNFIFDVLLEFLPSPDLPHDIFRSQTYRITKTLSTVLVSSAIPSRNCSQLQMP